MQHGNTTDRNRTEQYTGKVTHNDQEFWDGKPGESHEIMFRRVYAAREHNRQNQDTGKVARK